MQYIYLNHSLMLFICECINYLLFVQRRSILVQNEAYFTKHLHSELQTWGADKILTLALNAFSSMGTQESEVNGRKRSFIEETSTSCLQIESHTICETKVSLVWPIVVMITHAILRTRSHDLPLLTKLSTVYIVRGNNVFPVVYYSMRRCTMRGLRLGNTSLTYLFLWLHLFWFKP